MSEQILLDPSQLSRLSEADTAIAAMAEEYLPLAIKGPDDKPGFELVHSARMTVRAKRIEVEKTRKELKEDALKYGRTVDAEAKRITALLEPIETHLKTQEDAYNAERERLKAEAEQAARDKLQARVDALVAVGLVPKVSMLGEISDAAFETMLAEQTERYNAEQAELERQRVELERLEAEQRKREEAERLERERLAKLERIEQERIEAEQRAKFEAEQAELRKQQAEMRAEQKRMQAERDRMAAEQRKIDEAKREADRQEQLRIAREEAAEQSRKDDQARIEREAAEKIRREQEAESARLRAESLKPIREQLAPVADVVRACPVPDVDHPAVDRIRKIIEDAADSIELVVANLA